MHNEEKNFSEYLVIFIDILGSQERTEFEEMYRINSIFYDELEKNKKNDMQHTVYSRKIYTFSDCAYIFYHYKEGIADDCKDIGKLFTVALCNCESLFLRFLKEKIIFRGGISFGKAYIDSQRSMFFGEAVNEAYKLESKVAVHPRIVIDPFVAKMVEENILKVKSEILNNSLEYKCLIGMQMIPYMPETGEGVIEKDIDGRYIFNFLHLPENNMNLLEAYLSPEDFIKELIQYCHEQINRYNEYKIIDKYYYLLRFCETKLDNLLEYTNY